MPIKTYRAKSVHEALQMVRRDMGPEAVVLRTQEVRAGGFLGLWGGTPAMEVTATLESPAFRRWLRASGPLDRGIDLAGEVPGI